TTPIDDEVLNSYIKTQKQFFANTSSMHKLGQITKQVLEQATKETLDVLGLSNHHLVYTSNATEANNLAIYGIAHRYLLSEGLKWRLITTKMEHPSVYEVFKALEQEGYDVIYLDVSAEGTIDLEQFRQALNKQTVLVSIMWVNNIVGSIQPIKEVLNLLEQYPKATFHMDAVQGLCKVQADFDFNKVDLFTMSTHKIYGPKGVGFLAYRSPIRLTKRLYGSQAQDGIKPGTLDLALAVATCKALKIYYPKTKEHYQQVQALNNYLRSGLANLPMIHINSPKTAVPYILSIALPSVNAETLLHALEALDIYVSAGSACHSKERKPERTVMAMTNSLELATSTIRISLSHLSTKNEIDQLLLALKDICHV
ncbi:MAG TPA: cysteine desulfurase family protein, partial [Bacilli bacterium]|nr:cysteine desulfurase family protein [Bacilli bacterium]